MPRIIYCAKLKKDAIGFDKPPMGGEVGNKIYEHISQEAWQMWLKHQTMLINEYRLNLLDPKSKSFLLEEMEKFLFGVGSDKPEGYTPET